MEPNDPTPQETPIVAQPVPPGTANLPPYLQAQAPPRRRSSLVLTLIVVALAAVLSVSVLINMVLIAGQTAGDSSTLQEEFFSQDKFRDGDDKIAIIRVEGTILGTEGYVMDQIDQARRDDDVKAIVLRVDSPGGTVSASDYLYHHLTQLRTESGKPIVVSMGSMAASGGYYIAMAAGSAKKTIYAEPTCFTGSIGVMIPHYNVAGLFEKYGIEEDAVVSHPLKNMGSLGKQMTDEERAIFQQLIDEGFERFKKIIRDNRTAFADDPEALDELATGQIFTAQQAKEGGLIDEIGFIESAIDRAIELAGADPNEVQVVRYKRTPSLVALLMGAQAKPQGLDLQQLFDLSAPRAYYMATQLPVPPKNSVRVVL